MSKALISTARTLLLFANLNNNNGAAARRVRAAISVLRRHNADAGISIILRGASSSAASETTIARTAPPAPSSSAAAAAVVTVRGRRWIPIDRVASSSSTTTSTSSKDGSDDDDASTTTTSVPLTVTDFHLRHEQLPFAYFFRETLDAEELASSLRRVLAYYPVVGGSIDLSGDGRGGGGVYIRCRNGEEKERDTVPLSFGTTDVPLSRWLGEADGDGAVGDVMGHDHESGAGHPTLLPLFDPLFSPASSSDREMEGEEECHTPAFRNLMSVRVTHPTAEAGGGTIIGVNANHALADAASCVRLVECWGREMRRRGGGEAHRRSSTPRGASNERSGATCSGMMSRELMDLLGEAQGAGSASGRLFRSADMLPEFAVDCYDAAAAICDGAMVAARSAMLGAEKEPNATKPPGANGDGDERCSSSMKHEYVHLPFPLETLGAMKAHGMMHSSATSPAPADLLQNGPGFVSTNDMITAAGWLIKRRLSGEADWNVSMIVNLRGRCGVDDFADVEGGRADEGDSPDGERGESRGRPSSRSRGVFGNGITNVVATLPPAVSGADGEGTSIEGGRDTVADVSNAAASIRAALVAGFDEVPDRIARSRIGRPASSSTNESSSAGIFSTTSWGAFSSLWDIRFSPSAEGGLMGFHAHPSHPLPSGRTFSSVIVPTKDGGYVYKLLLPSHLAQEARELHRDMCTSFLDWHDSK